MHSSNDGFQAGVRFPQQRHLLIFVVTISYFAFTPALFEEDSYYQRTASLTCKFYENMRETRQQFKIVGEKSETALRCSWKDDKPYCIIGDGYSFDWHVSDKVTCVKQLSVGPGPKSCSCFLLEEDMTEFERPCEVAVTGQEISKELPKQPSGLSQDTPSPNSASQDISSDPSASKTNVALLASVIVLTVVFVVLIVLVVFMYRHFRKIKSGYEPPGTNVGNEMEREESA